MLGPYVICIITALSIPGLILMAYKRNAATVSIVVILVLYPLVYYVVVSDMRYRCPILWLSLLPAGYLLAYVAGTGQRLLKPADAAVAAVSER